MLVLDDFLESYDALRVYADTAAFTNLTNPVDGVVYPLICADIPDGIKAEIFAKLEAFKGAPIESPTLFMRRSPAGVRVPHAVHSDMSMGRYSLMLYLNRSAHCQGGTSFLSHKATGIGYNPEHPVFAAIVVEDQNNPDAWTVREMVDMQPNRAVIFDASRLHRAEPTGGFGTDPRDMRVVLTCFFS